MLDQRVIQEVRESLRNMTDTEYDELMAELQRDGIIDEHGNVLKRMPVPPYVPDANGELKKPARPRKRGSRGRHSGT